MNTNIKNIYIIRHGETEFNRQGIVQGSGIDAGLNEKGHAQASAFYEYYKGKKFDKIYTSMLKRTHQSVAKFIDSGIEWQQHMGLNEISWGKREGKLPDKEDNLFFSEITNRWNSGQTHQKFDDGESPNEVAERLNDFLEILINNKNEHTVLIAMHGRALKILLSKIIYNDLSKMDEFEHTNLCLYKLQYDYSKQNFEIRLLNDTTHLI